MDHDDILTLEALHLLNMASDELLSLADTEELDFNRLARTELRSRRRHAGHQAIAAMAARCLT
jgi:hypothetical protein